MNHFKKLLVISVSLALFGGVSFARNCPEVGGYTLSSRAPNNASCTYISSAVASRGQMAIQNCPRFILTDRYFRQQGNCSVAVSQGSAAVPSAEAQKNKNSLKISAARCVCIIRAIQ